MGVAGASPLSVEAGGKGGTVTDDDGGATVAASPTGGEPVATTVSPNAFRSCTNWDALICSSDTLLGTGTLLAFWAYVTLGWASLYRSLASLNDTFFVAFIALISLSLSYAGHVLSYDVC